MVVLLAQAKPLHQPTFTKPITLPIFGLERSCKQMTPAASKGQSEYEKPEQAMSRRVMSCATQSRVQQMTATPKS